MLSELLGKTIENVETKVRARFGAGVGLLPMVHTYELRRVINTNNNNKLLVAPTSFGTARQDYSFFRATAFVNHTAVMVVVLVAGRYRTKTGRRVPILLFLRR